MRYAGAVRLAIAVSSLSIVSPLAAAEPSLVQKGEYLATAGSCVSCHTVPGGQPYAGGRNIETPFGSVASPNITPDRDTGIGAWSDDQFYRAMHEGIGAADEYLYPVFPYTRYTKVSRDDVLAIKTYLMSLPAVHSPRQPDGLTFPYNVRESLAVWRELFFTEGEFEPNPAQTAQVNRGAYLVEGLGHCGECHSQRNALGGVEQDKALQGAPIQGYYAPNITSDVEQGIGGWTEDQLVAYLKTGSAPGVGVVAGPMSEVVHASLGKLTDEDVRAMAAYLKSTPAKRDEEEPKPAIYQTAQAPGGATYLSFCAGCHGVDGQGRPGAVPPLAGNGSVTSEGPENVIRAVIGGLRAQGSWGPMPAMGADMTDDQIAEVTNYVRNTWSNTAPANAAPGQVAELASRTPVALAREPATCPAPEATTVASTIQDPASGVGDVLRSVDGVNMLERVTAGIDKLKTALPAAPQEQIVNGMVDAYCPIVAGRSEIDLDERRWQLQRFTQLVYTQVRR